MDVESSKVDDGNDDNDKNVRYCRDNDEKKKITLKDIIILT